MATKEPHTRHRGARDYERVFVVEIVYLLALFALAIIYVTNLHTLLPLTIPQSFGTVSIGVPWFGALGAVMISLTGLFNHHGDWKAHLKYWHFSRPLIGAALGIIAVLTFQAGVLAVGFSPSTTPNVTSTSNLLYYLIAFMVGYREEIFRELIKRLGDVIFTPGNGTVSATPSGAPPTNGHSAGGGATASDSAFVHMASANSNPNDSASLQADSAIQRITTPPTVSHDEQAH